MTHSLRILTVQEPRLCTPALAGLPGQRPMEMKTVFSCQDALQQLTDYNPQVVLLDFHCSTAPGGTGSLIRLLEALDTQGIACMIISGKPLPPDVTIPEWVQRLTSGISEDELWGRLASIEHYRQIVRQSQLEMRHMQRLSRHINRQFSEIDQDMRLASRLQREFLPIRFPDIPGLAFSVLYRPASWVSGDIYDVARIDEQNIGLYVADAVGHGMAASLLTMFVKRAIHGKVIEADHYRVLSPCETLQRLNESLTAENLNNAQFVTACYALLNHRTMTLEFARGGHPYPILIDVDGSLQELCTDGALLGLFSGQEFPTKKIQLQKGQKVIIHSDGMDVAFVESRDQQTGKPRYTSEFQKLAALPAEQMTRKLEIIIEEQEGSLNPQDDITMIVLEVVSS